MVKKVVTKTVTITEDGKKKMRTTKKTSAAKKRTTTKRKAAPKKRKTAAKKKTTTVKSTSVSTSAVLARMEKKDSILIDNFVGLQKAMTNLSLKFSELSKNMNNLLAVFEGAAKTLAASEKQVDATLTSKLDALVAQNKDLSREINNVDANMRRAKPAGSNQLYARQLQSAPVSSVGMPKRLPSV
ncbi:MAG: hypothetical protein ACI83O_000856 [Patescibacteria group bacterium]|jgi:hypothetical protein